MNSLNEMSDAGDDMTRKRLHHRKRWYLVVAILFCLTNPVQGEEIRREVNPANGHTYLLIDLLPEIRPRDNTWENLEAEAVFIGGHLVTINDAEEDAWISAAFADLFEDQNIFIGLNDIVEEGTFVWVSGEPVTYTNFQAGEPNNAGGAENVVAMEFCCGHIGDWNDKRLTSQNRGLVEVIAFPDPIELGLIVDKATGALSLNTGDFPTTFDSYNITSFSGALDPSGWIAGNLAAQATGGGLSADLDGDGDVDGNDFLQAEREKVGGDFTSFLVDFEAQFGQVGGTTPGAQWEVLNDTQNQIFEAYLNGDSTIEISSSLSIGNGYDTASGVEDLVFTFGSAGKKFTGTVSYVGGSTATSVAVPEPSTLALVLLVAIFGVAIAWRKNSQPVFATACV